MVGGVSSSVLEELQDLAQLSSTLLCSVFFFLFKIRQTKKLWFGGSNRTKDKSHTDF